MRLREDTIFHSQFAEDRPVDWIDEIAAKFCSRKRLFVDEHDRIASLRQSDGRGRPSGTGTNDRYVEILHGQLLSEINASTRYGNIDWMRSVPTSARRNNSLHSEIVQA